MSAPARQAEPAVVLAGTAPGRRCTKHPIPSRPESSTPALTRGEPLSRATHLSQREPSTQALARAVPLCPRLLSVSGLRCHGKSPALYRTQLRCHLALSLLSPVRPGLMCLRGGGVC
jgi:hypothetical protein